MMNSIITAEYLFSKVEHGKPMVSRDHLLLKSGMGILGDVNANSISPRQVLLVSHSVLKKYNLLPGYLRENITVNGINVNDIPSGTLLSVGEEVVLRVTVACGPCDYIESLQTGLTRRIENERGVLATVIKGGKIQTGELINILAETTAAVPSSRFERFLWFVDCVPEGKVVTYNQIIDAIGGIKAHFRAIPSYIKNEKSSDYPIHRIVDSKGAILTHIPNQEFLLQKEGVNVNRGKVDLSLFQWQVESLYTTFKNRA